MNDESLHQDADDKDRIWILLDRYLAGESSAEDARTVRAWVAANAANKESFETARRIRELAASRPPARSVEDMWRQARVKLELGAPRGGSASASPERSPFRLTPPRLSTPVGGSALPLGIAALVAIVAGGVVFWQTRDRDARVAITEPLPMREVATAVGQRAEVKLGDGSIVTLGAKSRLRFPAVMGPHQRELHLEGEAHFTVTHDSTSPFIVRAAGTKVVDLGTAFVVRAYPTDQRVQVVVSEGRVSLSADRQDAPQSVLIAGQMARLARDSTVPVVSAVDPSDYTEWLRGRLVFDNTPLAAVVDELSRWYDVDVRLRNPDLAKEPFSATFAIGSLTETLQTIATVLHLRVERQGTVVFLSRGPR